jgi:hypothetical protein
MFGCTIYLDSLLLLPYYLSSILHQLLLLLLSYQQLL